MADLASLPTVVRSILKDFPNLDMVFINRGIQKCYSLFDPATQASSEQIIHKITTNFTAPNILA